MGKIVTFGTLKGGVGKTLICFSLAGILAEEGKKVLVIDSDLQGNLTNNMGIDRTKSDLKTMYDIYNIDSEKSVDINSLIIKAPISDLQTLDIIPGSIFLHKAELKVASVAGRELILKNYMEENESVFKQYDYILIDTNPSMSIVNQNAFLVADSLVLLSDISMNAIEGAQLFIALWDDTRKRLRKDDNIKGFIINDFDKRNKLSNDYLEFLNSDDSLSDLKKILLNTIIPRNIKLSESELEARPINIYDKGAKGYEALKALADEMKVRGIL